MSEEQASKPPKNSDDFRYLHDAPDRPSFVTPDLLSTSTDGLNVSCTRFLGHLSGRIAGKQPEFLLTIRHNLLCSTLNLTQEGLMTGLS
jgi:hypothetical protein